MKKNQGFTLVELIAIILILSVMALILYPNVINMINNNTQKKYDTMIKNIEIATENYVERNRDILPNLTVPGATLQITYQNLVDANLLEADLINPKTNKALSSDTIIEVVVNSDALLTYDVKIND